MLSSDLRSKWWSIRQQCTHRVNEIYIRWVSNTKFSIKKNVTQLIALIHPYIWGTRVRVSRYLYVCRVIKSKASNTHTRHIRHTCIFKNKFLRDLMVTLRQALVSDEHWPAICVQNIDVQCVLQFTLIHTVCCVLHRLVSRVIHRQEFIFSIFYFKSHIIRGHIMVQIWKW